MTSEVALDRTQLAVLGSPVGHSLSPRLHTAAYRTLGVPWSYRAAEVTGAELPEFVANCGREWRGLSLTMPLKREVIPLLDSMDRAATLTGVANTLLFEGGLRRGFNTDVAGMVRPLREAGVHSLDEVVILGGGATAASAVAASAELGASSVVIWMRSPEKATGLQRLGTELGIVVEARTFTDLGRGIGRPEVVFSTLPNGAVVDLLVSERVRSNSVLFDVAYDPWPTALADTWAAVSSPVISGLEMLLAQALVQVRIFVSGDPEAPLPQEDRVVGAMRHSVGLE